MYLIQTDLDRSCLMSPVNQWTYQAAGDAADGHRTSLYVAVGIAACLFLLRLIGSLFPLTGPSVGP